MNCKRCGAPLTPGVNFCTNCGQPVDAQPTQMNNQGMANQQQYNQANQNTVSAQPVNPVAELFGNSDGAQNNNPSFNQQPSTNYQNNTYTQNSQSNETPTQKSITLGNVIGLILGIVLGIGFFAAVLYFEDPEIFDKIGIGNKTQNTEKDTTSNKNNTSKDKDTKTTTSKVTFGGFVFEIPGEFEYQKVSNTLSFTDKAKTWYVEMAIASGSYEATKAKKADVKDNLKISMNATSVTDARVVKLGNVEYIICEAVIPNGLEKVNVLVAYAKLDDNNVAAITVQKAYSSKAETTILEEISPIILSASKTSR